MKFPYMILALLLLFASCDVKTDVNVSTTPDETKTKEILDHHWNTFQANDLDGVMADYTEESVLITPDKTVSGLADLRKHFADVFLLFPTDSTTLKLDKSIVNKDVAYIIWSADAPKIDISYGTDTFIIKDGKIVRQTFAGVVTTP